MQDSSMKSYLKEIDSIKKYLYSSSQLRIYLSDLDNYLEQIKCVNRSSLFEKDKDNQALFNLDLTANIRLSKEETKQKLLFKITSLANDSIQLVKAALLVK